MEKDMMKPNHEILQKWNKFYFYDDFFEVDYKINLTRKNKVVYYKDITNISDVVNVVNFVPFYICNITIAGEKKPLVLAFRTSHKDYVQAVEFIKGERAKYILSSM